MLPQHAVVTGVCECGILGGSGLDFGGAPNELSVLDRCVAERGR
jgi:hypothetical protein